VNTSSEGLPRRVAVIGGGITGLAAAHRLLELKPDLEVRLFEADDRLGGVLQTFEDSGYLFERSADNFISNVPYAVDLCRRLGLQDELLSTNDAYRRAFVVRGSRLYPVPDGFMLMAAQKVWPVLTTPILSLRGKLRLLAEFFLSPRQVDDESLASFARRRLGREAFERLVQPLVGGIYTADAEKLSLAATLPRFLEMEREHGSLIRAALKQRKAAARGSRNGKQHGAGESGARYSLFLAPRLGMSQLINALAARLGERVILRQAPVVKLERSSGPESHAPWTVHYRQDDQALSYEADAVIVALPAYHAARLLEPLDAPLAGLLNEIPYAGSAIVSLGYRRDQVRHPLDGFGFVVPAIERRDILAGSFSSVKFAGRAPDDCVLIRVFLGGSSHPHLVEAPEAELRAITERELKELLGVTGEPQVCHVTRWTRRMPQYHLGHLERVARIEAAVANHPGLALAGSAYRGVGIPDCIRSAEAAAHAILGQPQTAPTQASGQV